MPSNNRLLDFDLMAPHLESVTLGVHLERPNRRITALYFPEGRWRTTIFANGTSQASPSATGEVGRNAMYKDTYPWPIKCHICLNEFTVEVGRMKAEKELRCPGCGGRLEYMVKQFESKLAEAIRLRLDPYRYMLRLKKPL
jgi:DNA-directed RNA polymerase subunit RPC12/RpoP